jgi:hypothetical protein
MFHRKWAPLEIVKSGATNEKITGINFDVAATGALDFSLDLL